MSRRLINGRDWQLLTTAVGSGIRHFSSSSFSWDHRDVVVNYHSEIQSSIDTPSSDWYRHFKNENKRAVDEMLQEELDKNFREIQKRYLDELLDEQFYEHFEGRLWDWKKCCDEL